MTELIKKATKNAFLPNWYDELCSPIIKEFQFWPQIILLYMPICCYTAEGAMLILYDN